MSIRVLFARTEYERPTMRGIRSVKRRDNARGGVIDVSRVEQRRAPVEQWQTPQASTFDDAPDQLRVTPGPTRDADARRRHGWSAILRRFECAPADCYVFASEPSHAGLLDEVYMAGSYGSVRRRGYSALRFRTRCDTIRSPCCATAGCRPPGPDGHGGHFAGFDKANTGCLQVLWLLLGIPCDRAFREGERPATITASADQR